MGKTLSLEDYKQITSFQSLHKTLLQGEFSADLEKPLAYWALPGDRRLPLAFLGRTLRELLHTSFEDLSATPGIGQKKVGSLLKLLSRAAKKRGASDSQALAQEKTSWGARGARASREFNPEEVSEAHWEIWRETVQRLGMGSEKLGRLCLLCNGCRPAFGICPFPHISIIQWLKCVNSKRTAKSACESS